MDGRLIYHEDGKRNSLSYPPPRKKTRKQFTGHQVATLLMTISRHAAERIIWSAMQFFVVLPGLCSTIFHDGPWQYCPLIHGHRFHSILLWNLWILICMLLMLVCVEFVSLFVMNDISINRHCPSMIIPFTSWLASAVCCYVNLHYEMICVLVWQRWVVLSVNKRYWILIV